MRALVLSGGGSKGAYQAGAIFALGSRYDYDMYCGVSVGALNAAFLSQFPSTRVGAPSLLKIWRDVQTKDVHKKWFFGYLAALWKPSIYNSEPLEKWVRSVLRPNLIKKKLSVGATSLNTGEYFAFDEGSDQIVEAVIASASFPGFFKPVSVQTDWWIDGGVRNVTPLAAAIHRGATAIDVITLDSPGVPRSDKKPKSINVLKRTIEVMLDEIVENDLKTCALYNEHGIKRKIELNVYRPAQPLGVDPLKFERQNSIKLINRGYIETQQALVGTP